MATDEAAIAAAAMRSIQYAAAQWHKQDEIVREIFEAETARKVASPTVLDRSKQDPASATRSYAP